MAVRTFTVLLLKYWTRRQWVKGEGSPYSPTRLDNRPYQQTIHGGAAFVFYEPNWSELVPWSLLLHRKCGNSSLGTASSSSASSFVAFTTVQAKVLDTDGDTGVLDFFSSDTNLSWNWENARWKSRQGLEIRPKPAWKSTRQNQRARSNWLALLLVVSVDCWMKPRKMPKGTLVVMPNGRRTTEWQFDSIAALAR